MKKKLLSLNILSLVIGLGLLWGCSSAKSSYESKISVNPESAVIGVKLNQIITKSDLRNLLPEQSRNQLLSGLIQEDGVRSFVTDLVNDAAKTGLNCDENLYFVVTQPDEYVFDMSLFAAVDNFSKLESYLAGNSMYAVQSEGINDFKHAVVTVSGQTLNALYDKDVFILTASENLEALTKPTQTITSYSWAEVFSKGDDLTFVVQSNFLTSATNSLSAMFATSSLSAEPAPVQIPSGLYQALALNFEKGQVVYNQSMFAESSQAKEFLDSAVSVFGNISDKFVSKIAVDPFLFLNMSLHGKKLFPYLNMVLGEKFTMESLGEETYTMANRILTAIQGDVSLAINEIDINFFKPSVDFSLFVEATPELYPMLVGLIKESEAGLNAIQFETEQVLTLSERGFTVYLVNAGDYVMLTTDETLAEDPSMKMSSDLSKSRYYKKTDGQFYAVIDIQKILAIPMVQVGLSSLPTAKFPGVTEMINTLDYLESNGSTTLSQTRLVLKNKDDNSLKLVVGLLKNLAGL